jgi:hypothetical protein
LKLASFNLNRLNKLKTAGHRLGARRFFVSLLLPLTLGSASCGGGSDGLNSLNPQSSLSTSVQNSIVSNAFSLFAFALTGYWVQGGAGLRVDSNSIEVRNGCASFNFAEPYDATSQDGGLAIRGRVSAAGDVVLFLKVVDSPSGLGGSTLALSLRDSGGTTLVSAPNMSRFSGPLASPIGC